METYSNREITHATVTEVGETLKHDAWFDNEPPKELASLLKVGDQFDIECTGTLITGWFFAGSWYDRKSDQLLEAERQQLIEKFAQQRRDELIANRRNWQERTDKLPDWIRVRIESFQASGGKNFELEGWGYELIVAELAVMYEASNCEDTDEINAYARKEGTSGNQHGMAKALAKARIETPEKSLAGTVAALAPITGNPDYSSK